MEEDLGGSVATMLERALAVHRQGQLAEAKALYEAILKQEPRHFEALNMLGAIAVQTTNFDAAVRLIGQAIAINPSGPIAHNNLGNALFQLNRLDEALASYERAIALAPEQAEAHFNRGNVLLGLNRLSEALASFDTAIAFKSDYAEAYSNRGSALRILRRLPEALASYDKALALNPTRAETHFNRANVLVLADRIEDALAGYEEALALKPSYEFQFGLVMLIRLKLCEWTGLEDRLEKLRADVKAGKRASEPFPLLNFFDDPQLLKQAAVLYAATKYSRAAPPFANRAHEKIRVGYYSADFHNHATARLAAELFECHDRSRFEVYGFSFGPDKRDEMRARVSAAFDRFLDVREQSDREIARLSREMEIDIAVDLKGYTQDSRVGIFAARCAPIQVSYLAYPGTMGADFFDYIVADKIIIPPAQQGDFTEKVIYMPHSYQVNDSRRQIAPRAFTRAELGLPQEGFVFCCFNNGQKILPAIFDVWMRLLRTVDTSVLWLLNDSATAVNNFRKEAIARGVAPDRLIFAGRMPLDQHLARHRMADLFLDTLPCNAHTTASDALWAGLPLLTCTGTTFTSRVAASLLLAIGLPELVTDTMAAYEAKALDLARDPAKLAAIREKLAANRRSSPLFDGKLFAKHLEAAYTTIYQRSQAGLPPEGFAVG